MTKCKPSTWLVLLIHLFHVCTASFHPVYLYVRPVKKPAGGPGHGPGALHPRALMQRLMQLCLDNPLAAGDSLCDQVKAAVVGKVKGARRASERDNNANLVHRLAMAWG